jgi:hypothetical protein
MPIREGQSVRPSVPNEEVLRRELTTEIEHPKESGEPEIIIERPSASTIHLFVVWSKWSELEQIVRSRITLDAFREARGEEEALRVTVAMGLTREEAGRLGIT